MPRRWKLVKNYKIGPIYTPPVVSNPNGPIATIMVGAANGGTNWPGGSFNPENHTVYVYGCNDCMSLTGLVPPPPGMTDLPYVEGLAGQTHRDGQCGRRRCRRGCGARGQAAGASALAGGGGGGFRTVSVQGLPLFKPPYATISAINLDKGDIVWQVAHGDTPDYIRNNPALKGINVPRTGQAGFNIGTLVTKSPGDRRRRPSHHHARSSARRDAARL